MKYLPVIFSLFIIVTYTHVSYGQSIDPQEEVQQVLKKYREAESLKLDFEFQLRNPEQPPRIFEGTFYKIGDLYKVDLNDYTIYSDGKAQYTVQKEAQEVQITTIDPESIELSSLAGILKYIENQHFKYFDKSALKQGGRSLRIIELVPTDKSSEYFKIRFSFTQPAKQLKYIEIFARDGQRIQLTVGDTSFSGNFSRKSVEWDPALYKDYYIEDLRID